MLGIHWLLNDLLNNCFELTFEFSTWKFTHSTFPLLVPFFSSSENCIYAADDSPTRGIHTFNRIFLWLRVSCKSTKTCFTRQLIVQILYNLYCHEVNTSRTIILTLFCLFYYLKHYILSQTKALEVLIMGNYGWYTTKHVHKNTGYHSSQPWWYMCILIA